MSNDIISNFRGQYAFLSNFYTCPIEYMGLDFSCVESAFQAAKCLHPADREAFQYMTARDAKRHGRCIQMRPDWDEAKVNVMQELLFMKFGKNQDLLQQLLDTGDAQIIEDNVWHDNYWGNCVCKSSKCNKTGENVLGKLLMSVRKTYKHQIADTVDYPIEIKNIVYMQQKSET